MPDELETRKRVYSLVREEPGLHFRELERRLGMATGLLDHHLRHLEAHEVIIAREDRYYKRYFPAELAVGDKCLISSLRQKNPRRIVVYLLIHPGASHRELMAKLSIKPSTLSLYLEDLNKKGTVLREKRGREHLYTVADPKNAEKVLIEYKSSLLDDLVDTFLDAWLSDVL